MALRELTIVIGVEITACQPAPDGAVAISGRHLLHVVQELFGFSCSLSSLSEFYKWLRLKRRMESAAERSSQARLALASDPGMTPELLARVGQMVFTAETIEDGNVKAYVELVKLQLQAAKQEMELRKLKILESKAAALDALQAKAKEIKAGGGLSAETLEVIEKQLKLL